MTDNVPAKKLTWFIIVLAFSSALVIYGVVGYLIAINRPPPEARGMLDNLSTGGYVLAAILIIFGIKIFPRPTFASVAPLEVFQTKSIISLALFESIGLIGLVLVVLGSEPIVYITYGLPALLPIIFLVIPQGLKYWRLQEGGGSAGHAGMIQH